MPQEKTILIYTLEELQGKARERAFETLREWSTDHDWHDCAQDDFHAFLRIAGFDNITSQFSGFWSQGDGASFDFKGLDVAKLLNEDVSGYEPYSAAVIAWRKEWLATLRNTKRISGVLHCYSCKNSYGNHYAHARTRYAECELDYPTECCSTEPKRVYAACEDFSKALTALMRTLGDCYYSALEADYTARTSEDYLKEFAAANEYQWDALGRPA